MQKRILAGAEEQIRKVDNNKMMPSLVRIAEAMPENSVAANGVIW